MGAGFALLAAATFGLNIAIMRRGLIAGSAALAVYFPVLVSLPLFVVVAAATGELARAPTLPIASYILLVAAGVVHFAFGRYFNYRALELIGANRMAPFHSLALVVSVAIAVVLLQEELTTLRAIGVICIAAAAFLAALQRRGPGLHSMAADAEVIRLRAFAPLSRAIRWRTLVDPRAFTLGEGYAFGLLCAAAYGVSPIMVRAALEDVPLGVLGGFVSQVAAAAALVIWFMFSGRAVFGSAQRTAIKWFLFGAVINFVAQVSHFIALSLAPVVVVIPLEQTVVIFTVAFSYLINRRTESFSPPVVMGIVLTLIGSVALVI